MAEDKLVSAGQLRFEVDASLLVQLGEQLFTRRSIALTELIKNAYDADATLVTVEFKNVSQPNGTIVVSDNGTGMTLQEVQNHWMRIATDYKRTSRTSPLYGRPRAGAKGIGRFAVRHLADRLVLDTVAIDNGSKRRTIVHFDWSEQFADGDTLTNIEVDYTVEDVPDETPTGVDLHLEDVHVIWTSTDISDVQKDLYVLLNPFPHDIPLEGQAIETDPGFHFTIVAPEFPEFEGRLSDSFYASAWSVLRGQVDTDGNAHYQLNIRDPAEALDFDPVEEDFALVKDVTIEVHYYNWQARFFRDTPIGLRQGQQTGRSLGGVRVYLDTFRVFPYGDTAGADDWLGLAQAGTERTRAFLDDSAELDALESEISGRPILLLPRNNQLFGTVSIPHDPDKTSSFEIIANREGFVENEAFRQLRRFVQVGLWWMTLQYARVTEAEREERRKARRLAKRPGVVDLIREAKNRVENDPSIENAQKGSILGLLETALQEATLEREDHISEVSLLRILSATGTAVSMMNHQLRAMLSGIRAAAVDLEEFRPFIKDQGYKKYREIIDQINRWREGVRLQVSQLGFLLGPEVTSKRKRIVLSRMADDVASPFSIYMRKYGIEFINAVPANVKTPPMYSAELYAVLLHAFTNSLKAVRKQKVSRIAVQTQVSLDGLYIHIVDTGTGVPEDMRDEVFQLFKSTSIPDPVIGVGTGLGLKIVRDTVIEYGGTARFIEPEDPWHTCLEIYLPE